MFRNYLIIAWRNVCKKQVFSLINILGLAIGMAACLLIMQYVGFQWSFDRFHDRGERIYRVEAGHYHEGKLSGKSNRVDPPIGPALADRYPEVERAARVSPWSGVVASVDAAGKPVAFNESGVLFAEPAFLDLFSFPLLEGTAAMLNEPNTAFISEGAARKYFGNENPIGKPIRLENHNQGHKYAALIRGVFRDVPVNSHLQFDFLVSRGARGPEGGWSTHTYLLLVPGANAEAFSTKLLAFREKPAGSEAAGSGTVFSVRPLRDIHLYSEVQEETTGRGALVWFLVIVAVLVLLIAYVNYTNLSAARAIERAREVGVRKVLGSRRADLLAQFFLEGLLINGVALVLAFTVVQLTLPWFNRLSSQSLAFTLWRESWFWAALLPGLCLGALLSGLYPALVLSGLYPALVLSAYRPVQVLKGHLRPTTGGITFRQALVCFQFAASIALMAGTFAVYRQVSYMRSKNLGLDMAQTLVVAASQERRANQAENELFERKDSLFRREVRLVPGVAGVTSASTVPGKPVDWAPRYFLSTSAPDQEAVYYDTYSIGYEFLDQFEVKVIAGQTITPHLRHFTGASGKTPVMLNEAAAKAMGFPNSAAAVGHVFYSRNGMGRNFPLEVTGVIANFHQGSLREDYRPGVFQVGTDAGSVGYYALKVNPHNLPQTVRRVEATFKGLFPGSPFSYFFLDEHFAAQYWDDQQFGRIFGLFAGLTIFVACMGLFGLSVLAAQGRRKEIGVRKVLGASVPSIVRLLARDFAGVILVANVAAWPLAYWGIREWLASYAFRIEINAWLFVLPTGLVLLVALLTVSVQTWRAARANPVRSLRHE